MDWNNNKKPEDTSVCSAQPTWNQIAALTRIMPVCTDINSFINLYIIIILIIQKFLQDVHKILLLCYVSNNFDSNCQSDDNSAINMQFASESIPLFLQKKEDNAYNFNSPKGSDSSCSSSAVGAYQLHKHPILIVTPIYAWSPRQHATNEAFRGIKDLQNQYRRANAAESASRKRKQAKRLEQDKEQNNNPLSFACSEYDLVEKKHQLQDAKSSISCISASNCNKLDNDS
jgi:hypothetical protein